MNFANPHWLWFLVCVPLLGISYYWIQRRQQARFEKFASSALWDRISPELHWPSQALRAGIGLFVLIFLIIALARPQWGYEQKTFQWTGFDLLVILDLSQSMEVQDIAPSRLKKAKHALRKIIQGLHGDRVGIIVFAGSSFVACPLTTDLDYVLETLDTLTYEHIQNQGTRISTGLETALQTLKLTSEGNSQNQNLKENSQILLLVSDGEEHEEKAASLMKEVQEKSKSLPIQLFVLGVGTEKGGPIPIRDPQNSSQTQSYKRDSNGNVVISTFRPQALMELAKLAQGQYWTLSAQETEVHELQQKLQDLNRKGQIERQYLVAIERFQFPLAIAVFLLILQISLIRRKNPKKKAFFKALLLGVFAIHSTGMAADSLDAYLNNRSGIQSLESGQANEAEKAFEEAIQKSPNLPELKFNQGVAQLKQGKTEQSIERFKNSAEEAKIQNRPETAGSSYFNLGNVLSEKKDFNEAASAYVDAIDQARLARDEKLEAAARKNLELLVQQKQQQSKQEKNPDKEQKPSEPEKNENSNSSPESASEGQQENTKTDPSKDSSQQGTQQETREGKLSPEEINQVLSELSHREKELQNQLRKQSGQPQSLEKDW